jgi:hypothetical protein
MRNQAAPFASRTQIAINSYASGQKRLLRHVGGTEINSGITTAIGIIQFDSRMQLLRGCPLLAQSGQSDRTRVCPLLDQSGQPSILAGDGLSAYDRGCVKTVLHVVLAQD